MQITEKNTENYIDIQVRNSAGMIVTLCSLGASIREIRTPDKTGESVTVTMRPASEETFRATYYGKTIGRTAGRIANATFTINGKTAQLQKNNKGIDNLHGGASGLHAQIFAHRIARSDAYTDVVFTYFSPDGEGGYFGNVQFAVTYRIWENENKFSMIYDATTDEPTLINLTNHVYLNVSGDMREPAAEHTLTIAASRKAKLNEQLIIEGIEPVTPATDFRSPRKIGEKINEAEVQQYTHGYDHVYFLDKSGLDTVACTLSSEKSGIALAMRTTAPSVVFYSNSMPKAGMKVLPSGQTDEKYIAACLECERFSDGYAAYPELCAVTTPEKPYHEETEFAFTVTE
ncbi:MAG: galactose mutarotase [Clostridiales bacterium]|nr:galactose mutarotase [Clostridiales bacterium]